MDAAAAGEKPSTAQKDVNDMKTILESIQSVEECGMEGSMAPEMPERDKVRMNVNINAEGEDGIEQLIKIMAGAKTPQEAPVKLPSPHMMPDMEHGPQEPSMADLIRMSSDSPEMMDDDIEEEWDNSPDEEYSDHDTMIKDLSGGLNRQKKQYAKAQDGDNPMAVEEEELEASLRETLKQELLKKLQN